MKWLSMLGLGVLVLGQPTEPYQPVWKTPTVRLKWTKQTELRIVRAQIVWVKSLEDLSDESKWALNLFLEGEDANASSPERALRPEIDTLEDGSYWVVVRNQTEFGVWSPWSEAIRVLKGWRDPEPPGGCGLLR